MKLSRFRHATCKIKKKKSVQKVASQCILNGLAKTFRTRNLQNLLFSAFRNGICNFFLILTSTTFCLTLPRYSLWGFQSFPRGNFLGY